MSVSASSEVNQTGGAEVDPDVTVTPPKERRRVLISSFIGALIEWYDFYLYGIASAIVFSRLFFPDFDNTVGTLLAFSTLAVGFFARPLGGAIWGHFGDKIGRKKMLVLSIIAMGICTTAMGLLPTYEQIGILAPVLLVFLRLIQGLAGGGEWGGAVLMAMEHSPSKRGFSSSFPQMGLTGGILLASGVFALMTLLPEEDLLTWGWRVPFLLSAVLVVIGMWIRLGVSESPVFVAAQKKAAAAAAAAELSGETIAKPRAPLFEVFRHPKMLIITILLVIGPFAASAIYLTFATAYGIQVGFTAPQMLTATMIAAALGFLGQPVFAIWSDSIGRKKVVGWGLALQSLSGFLLFDQMNQGSLVGLYLAMCFAAAAHAMCYAPLAAWLGELFPTHLRYTGSSMGYQIAGSIGGGLTPAFCIALLLLAGGAPNSILVAVFMCAISLLSLVGVRMAKETYKSKL
ncbi:MAG: MHS family MFS transporter [Burkholderiaceae bacterium]|nr:MHS family MFS transporter [Microbacteriaceae bacterium]